MKDLLAVGGMIAGAVAVVWLICHGPAAVRARLPKAKPEPVTVTPSSASGIDDLISDAEAVNQTCAVDPAGLNWVEVECLRRNYLRMPDEDRYGLDLSFASIVTPEEVSD